MHYRLPVILKEQTALMCQCFTSIASPILSPIPSFAHLAVNQKVVGLSPARCFRCARRLDKG